jgi:hypothetical protein
MRRERARPQCHRGDIVGRIHGQVPAADLDAALVFLSRFRAQRNNYIFDGFRDTTVAPTHCAIRLVDTSKRGTVTGSAATNVIAVISVSEHFQFRVARHVSSSGWSTSARTTPLHPRVGPLLGLVGSHEEEELNPFLRYRSIVRCTAPDIGIPTGLRKSNGWQSRIIPRSAVADAGKAATSDTVDARTGRVSPASQMNGSNLRTAFPMEVRLPVRHAHLLQFKT